jgi:RNA polymerase sigma factor (sigma-70 family)
MSDPPDRDERLSALMAEAQRGSAAAYLELLNAITPRMRRLIRRRRGFLGDAIVEDILQDVLLSLHAVRATYDRARPFLPWLMAIVRHRLADHARQYARRGSREMPLDDARVTFAAVRPNTRDERPWEHDALVHAIQTLPSGQRQAIVLLKLRELSLKEASTLTGKSVGALKLATHRAMTTLRRTLGASSR